MFLSQLNDTQKDKLFLELATLVMIATGSQHEESHADTNHSRDVRTILNFKNELSAAHNSYLKQLLNNIHSSEAIMLTEYAKELDFDIDDIFTHRDFHVSPWRLSNKQFSLIFNFIEAALGKTLMAPPLPPTDGEEDTPYLTRSSVRLNILKITATELIQEKELSLTEKDKKIIITELLGAAFSSGDIETEELELIHHICLSLDLDGESLEELYEALANLYQANKTLTDLINE